jgi:DNA-binding MarR family transcriptional regulator
MSELPSQFSGPGESLGFLVWQVANAWQRKQRLALEPIGLTHVQFVLLAGVSWLEKSGAPITQANLARFVRVDEMMTSQVLRTLEKRGSVLRQTHPSDSRAKSLALSPEGERLLDLAVPLVEKADADFFDIAGINSKTLFTEFAALAATGRNGHDESTKN